MNYTRFLLRWLTCCMWFAEDSEDILYQPPPSYDHRISYGAEPPNFGDLRLPKGAGPHPVLVMIHGGYWRNLYDLEHVGYLCAALTASGFATWNIEYRRVGDKGGGWPGTFLDVASAINHLRTLKDKYNLDLDRVVVMGHSAGGQLALWAAAQGRIPRDSPLYVPNPLPLRAAISLAGVIDLHRASAKGLSTGAADLLIGGSPAQFPERYTVASPFELLPLGVRQFLVHGTDDVDVPFEISQGYCDAARSKGDEVTLIALRGLGHFELIDPASEAWPRVLQAVQQSMRDAWAG